MTPAMLNARNEAADGITMTHVELHEDYTGNTAVSNRAAITMAAASGGDRASSADVDLTVGAGETARYIVLYDAASAGNAQVKMPIGNDGFRQASIISDTFQCAGHGLSNGQKVVVFGSEGGAVPTGLTEGDTVYFVVSAATNTFQLSATSGGAAITGITNGKVRVSKIVERTDAAAFIVRVAAGTTFGVNP